MWIFTSFGFFSVVQKPGDAKDAMLTVRARSREDLEALRERYLPSLGAIREGEATDYRYRARASQPAFAEALAAIARDIDYDNFKNAVAARQGRGRAKVYEEVWAAMLAMQDRPRGPQAAR